MNHCKIFDCIITHLWSRSELGVPLDLQVLAMIEINRTRNRHTRLHKTYVFSYRLQYMLIKGFSEKVKHTLQTGKTKTVMQ